MHVSRPHRTHHAADHEDLPRVRLRGALASFVEGALNDEVGHDLLNQVSEDGHEHAVDSERVGSAWEQNTMQQRWARRDATERNDRKPRLTRD